MRIFGLLDFRHLVLSLFFGAITACVIYLAFRDRSRPIPAIMFFVYGGFVIWAVLYVILFGIMGAPL